MDMKIEKNSIFLVYNKKNGMLRYLDSIDN